MPEFKTYDLGLACFLATKGKKLKSIEIDEESTYERKRGIFVFVDDGTCLEWERVYTSYQPTDNRFVDAKIHFDKIKEMKGILMYNLGFNKK